MGRVCLISCGKQKVDGPVAAADLYVSDGFKKARAYAEARADRWYTLSAEHHLLAPTDPCSRYERTLKEMSPHQRQTWADRVLGQLSARLQPGDEVVILAGKSYRSLLVPKLEANGYAVSIPMEGQSQGRQKKWLKDRNDHARDVERFYDLLDGLAEKVAGPRLLSECRGRDTWPDRGVYFFFEPGEMRRSPASRPRVVRIGTHALREKNKTSLWSRLSAHKGTADGYGNHGGSVFRKHVGTAIMRRENKVQPTTWGGVSATEAERRGTRKLEGRVSAYLARTSVLWLSVADPPGPQSDRLILERNAIALLSQADDGIDPASKEWLGRFSNREKIRTSGLWNVDHVGGEYDREFLDLLEARIKSVPAS